MNAISRTNEIEETKIEIEWSNKHTGNGANHEPSLVI